MKNYFLIFLLSIIASSCDIISNKEVCAEFQLKNELSSTVILKTLQHVDSTISFTLDTFILAPKETRIMHKYCSLSNIDSYPTGSYAEFTFSNNKSKTDTLRNSSFTDYVDTISLYNKNKWTFDNSQNLLKIATYSITIKDSLEAR